MVRSGGEHSNEEIRLGAGNVVGGEDGRGCCACCA